VKLARTPWGTEARALAFTNDWARGRVETRKWPNCTDHRENAHQNDQLYPSNQKTRQANPIICA